MHQPAWITDRATLHRRQLRHSHIDDDGGEEIESDDAQRFVFATVCAGATGTVVIGTEIVRYNQSVPLRDQ